MVIKSLKHEYFVLVMLEQNVSYDIMLASFDGAKNKFNNIFSIIRIKDIDVVMSLTSFFLDMEHTHFTDFCECFILESDMYLAFRYAHQSENERLSNCVSQMKLAQRSKIAKAILSKLILQRISYPIMCAVLKPENIVISSDTHVSFNYFTVNFGDYVEDCKNKAMVHLAYLLNILFEKEIAHNQCESLNKFIDAIQRGSFEDCAHLYKNFSPVYDELISLDEISEVQSKSIVEKMEEFRRNVLVKFKPLLAAIIILIGALYLFSSISKTPQPAQRGNIEVIGDLNIEK